MIIVSQDGAKMAESSRISYYDVWPSKPPKSAGGFDIRVMIRGYDYHNLLMGHFETQLEAQEEIMNIAMALAGEDAEAGKVYIVGAMGKG